MHAQATAAARPETPMNAIAQLAPLRAHAGQRRTTGLDDATIERFAASHPDLGEAIAAAAAAYQAVAGDFAALLDLDEDEQIRRVQADFVNFYPQDAVNPYAPWALVSARAAA